MVDRKQELLDVINTHNRLLAEGVGAEREAILKAKVVSYQAELEELVRQGQKIADVDVMELPFDFDADFGTEGLNTIVRQMLKEERISNFAEFNTEYERVNQEADQRVNAALERESQLQRQNQELQLEYKSLDMFHHQLNEQYHKLSAELNQTKLERDDALTKRDNTVSLLEEARAEIERLEGHVFDLQNQLNLGERQSQRIIDVSKSLTDVYEQAKQATAEKRRVMVTAELGLYREVQGEDGTKEVIRATELETMDVVDHLELPEVAVPQENVSLPSVDETDNAGEPRNEQETLTNPHETTGNVAEEQVTRREFEALKGEVAQLAVDLRARGILPHAA